MQEPAYRWQKRKDHTGLTPAQKRAAMVAPAGANTASGGIVRPRNNEDPTALMSSAVNVGPFPTDAKDAQLVVSTASAHTSGARALTRAVDWLEEDEAPSAVMGATALAAGRRAFFALFDGHGGDECAEWAARELQAVVTRRLRGVRESAAIKAALKASFEECDAALLRECAAHGWEGRCHVAAILLDQHCTPTRAYVASCGTLQSFACCKEGAFGAETASSSS